MGFAPPRPLTYSIEPDKIYPKSDLNANITPLRYDARTGGFQTRCYVKPPQ